MAKHYKENVEPLGYRAFLVGVDREDCAQYKHALNQFLPPEYSEVAYTGSNSGSKLMEEFHLDPKKERKQSILVCWNASHPSPLDTNNPPHHF